MRPPALGDHSHLRCAIACFDTHNTFAFNGRVNPQSFSGFYPIDKNRNNNNAGDDGKTYRKTIDEIFHITLSH